MCSVFESRRTLNWERVWCCDLDCYVLTVRLINASHRSKNQGMEVKTLRLKETFTILDRTSFSACYQGTKLFAFMNLLWKV